MSVEPGILGERINTRAVAHTVVDSLGVNVRLSLSLRSPSMGASTHENLPEPEVPENKPQARRAKPARYRDLAIPAVGSFSAAAILTGPLASSGMGAVGLIALSALFLRSRSPRKPIDILAPAAGLAGLVIVALSFIDGLGPVPSSVDEIRTGWTLLVVLSCLFLATARFRGLRRLAVITALAAAISVTAAEALSDWESPGGYDVYRNHRAAGQALSDGENPYGDSVQVTSGNPFVPEGTVIIGYSYPPVVLGSYGLLALVTDPRLVSMVAWFAVIGWLTIGAIRSKGRTEVQLALLVLLATAPIWPLVWYSGWTEPLSIALLLGAGVLWKRHPVASAVVLGLALASKQYFIFLLPLLLLHKEEGQLKRTTIAIGTAAVTVIPALLIDASAYLQATVGNLADIGFRPDSQSLTGLLAEFGIEFSLHPLAWIALGLSFATLVARRSRTPSDFFMASALILGFSFWIGSAFPNYWFLVMALTAIGLAARDRETSAATSPATS